MTDTFVRSPYPIPVFVGSFPLEPCDWCEQEDDRPITHQVVYADKPRYYHERCLYRQLVYQPIALHPYEPCPECGDSGCRECKPYHIGFGQQQPESSYD